MAHSEPYISNSYDHVKLSEFGKAGVVLHPHMAQVLDLSDPDESQGLSVAEGVCFGDETLDVYYTYVGENASHHFLVGQSKDGKRLFTGSVSDETYTLNEAKALGIDTSYEGGARFSYDNLEYKVCDYSCGGSCDCKTWGDVFKEKGWIYTFDDGMVMPSFTKEAVEWMHENHADNYCFAVDETVYRFKEVSSLDRAYCGRGAEIAITESASN